MSTKRPTGKIKFTEAAIKKLPAEAAAYDVFEEGRKRGTGALGCRVHPSGGRSFFLVYRSKKGKVRRYTIGSHPVISVAKAKTIVIEKMGEVAGGGDPHQEKQDQRRKQYAADTMGGLWKLVQEDRENRPKSKQHKLNEKGFWERVILPKLGSVPVKEVTRTDLRDLITDYRRSVRQKARERNENLPEAELEKRGEVSGNRLISALTFSFNLAAELEMIESSPMVGLKRLRAEEKARSRTFRPTEIRKLWKAMEQISPSQRDIYRLIIYTGQRPGEVMVLRWSDLDLEERIWHQEINKTNQPHQIPLSPPAMKILEDRFDENEEFVFPSPKKKGHHVSSTADSRRQLQLLSGVKDFTTHDFRRYLRTLLADVDTDHHIRERILNHSLGKMEKTYDQADYRAEKKRALEDVADHLHRILGLKVIEGKGAAA